MTTLKPFLPLLTVGFVFLCGCGTGDYEARGKKSDDKLKVAEKFIGLEGSYRDVPNSPVKIRLLKGISDQFEGVGVQAPVEITGIEKFHKKNYYLTGETKYKTKDAMKNEVEVQGKLPVQLAVYVIDNNAATKKLEEQLKKGFKADWREETVTIAPRQGNANSGTAQCRVTEFAAKPGFTENRSGNHSAVKDMKGTVIGVLYHIEKIRCAAGLADS